MYSVFTLARRHYFYVPYKWIQDHHCTWSSQPREGLVKAAPLLLSYFKNLVLVWAGESNPGPPTPQSHALPTELNKLQSKTVLYM